MASFSSRIAACRVSSRLFRPMRRLSYLSVPLPCTRKEAIAARKKATKATENWQAAQPLTPAEMKSGQVAAAPRTSNDPIQPGTNSNPSLSPAELGFTGGLWNMMKGGNGTESKPFTSEPPRQSLVEPPPGYQTPSPNYAYGAGPDKSRRMYYDIMSGKDKEQ